MKKYLLSFVLFLTCSLPSFAQERVNRTKLVFEHEGPILENFTGWAYNDIYGEWIECQNVIETDKKNIKYSTSPVWLAGVRYNHIISLQFKTITFKDIHYYVLVWTKWGLNREKNQLFMMFTESEMEQLRNLTNDPIELTVPTPNRSHYEPEVEDVDVIQCVMGDYYPTEATITIYKATDGSIRFVFSGDGYSPNIEKEYFEITEEEYFNLLNI